MNDMLNMTENYVEETIELIKLSGHVVADRLVFEPLSDTSFEVFADFASRGISFGEKMSDEDELLLIDHVYLDPHIWPIAKKYVTDMYDRGASLTPDAVNFYGYIASNGEPRWPGQRRRNFYRDDLIVTLIHYLITQYDFRVNLAFGAHRNAPKVIIEAFKRLHFDEPLTVKKISNMWQRNINRSKYAKTYFMHRAARLALKLEDSGWRNQPSPVLIMGQNQAESRQIAHA